MPAVVTQVVIDKVNGFVSELRAGGPMRPGSKEAVAAEAEAASASKSKLSSAKPEEVKQAAAAKPSSTASRTLAWTETYYARPSDIYECFVVDGKVCAMSLSLTPCSGVHAMGLLLLSHALYSRSERSRRALRPLRLDRAGSSPGSTALWLASLWRWRRTSGWS